MSKDYMRIDPLWDSGNYLFMEEVDDYTCSEAIRFIQYHNMNEDNSLKELTLIINSPGGTVSSAMALIDVMLTSKIPVNTLAVGQVASCGVLLTMSGKKRSMSENCLAMSHQYSWGGKGKHEDLKAQRKAQDMTHDMLVKHYQKCTGKTKKYVERELMPHQDVWLSAEECVKHGIVDKVVSVY